MFFVLLKHPNPFLNYVPLMVDDDCDGDRLLWFTTHAEAESSAEENSLGFNYGYKIIIIDEV